MEIKRIPVLSDNYVFVLSDTQQKIAAVVDPAVAQPILDYLTQIDCQLVAIFNTHHHYDHVGGNQQLIEHFPHLCVYGGIKDRGRIPHQQVFLQQDDTVQFSRHRGRVFFVPGHTRAHIAYYFPPSTTEETGELFCGDTIFAGGCGRLFEGTPSQMLNSIDKLRQLPDNTRVWCAHEYTLNNLKFAITVDSNNLILQERYQAVQQARKQGMATVPSLLGIEKQTNPFLRWDTPAIQTIAKVKEPVRVFGRIRGMKDLF
ncbi:hydroxyacylglutathione hydrolase [Waterburya agarophytonicola K14]|uniref:Hydroxyacylglutathione hydrolase n=1 Tax=Waterburya agarophytonicola KI4 TaxID=2874699 RepID=A0A964BQJ5_9CYAN|nr:hydroxyacylglutathione hydrolase [Waterburya agarophytonicola]MCC0177754.1 hydroxyacylglutathione hydrolase [Waterburya agarophytonicola KI4]